MRELAQDDNAQQLAGLARRLRRESGFMASVLADYQTQEHMTEDGLAAHLNVDATQLVRLAMCRRPDTGSPMFGEQVKQIAAFTGADVAVLAGLLRQVEALTALRAMPPQNETPNASGLPAAHGYLAAARDGDASYEVGSDPPGEASDDEVE